MAPVPPGVAPAPRAGRPAAEECGAAPLSPSRPPRVASTIASPRAMRWLASWFKAKMGSSPGRSPLMRNGCTARFYSTRANPLLEIDLDTDHLHEPERVGRSHGALPEPVVEGHRRRSVGRLLDLLLEVHLVELGIELGRQVEKSDVMRRDGAHRAALEQVAEHRSRANHPLAGVRPLQDLVEQEEQGTLAFYSIDHAPPLL